MNLVGKNIECYKGDNTVAKTARKLHWRMKACVIKN